MDRLKHLIAISWVMPPIVLPRSIQIARSLKTLHQRGWASDVLSVPVEAVNGATQDDDFHNLYRSHYRQHYVEHREAIQPSPWLRRMIRKLRPPADLDEESFDEDNWIRRAGGFVLAENRRSAPDILITFAQPWVDHRVGLYVKQRCPDLPWLAHFSDPWVDSPYLETGTPELDAELQIWRQQEQAVMQAADAVAFVTQQTADLVMRKYPDAWRKKVHIIPHGFDQDARPPARPQPAAGGPLKLIYTGNIYAGLRDPECLFDAMAILGGPEKLLGRLQVAFYGNAPVETTALLEERGLGGIVTFHGSVGYLESLRLAADADLLLLIDAAAEVNVFLPSKIVDYLMLDKPILGLTPLNGASAAVLEQTGHLVVPPKDAKALAEMLQRLIARFEAGEPIAVQTEEATDGFDIRRTTDLLETAMTAAIERSTYP